MAVVELSGAGCGDVNRIVRDLGMDWDLDHRKTEVRWAKGRDGVVGMMGKPSNRGNLQLNGVSVVDM